ncbi:RNA pyrophosphohydrolase [Pseudohalocynthiibacter sp. F2068]|jgi:putative (di)nucleoside polyphosphate hydrolase|uniref:RNA pyrophosphohydrolase n=1 Tax=Pseudohalocynthiibacter sp. F2068 TaxID=2926418 RepID=UPI001FF244C3|nr:RNA pyrophosphohydrolase [Pseudohalocynthiibacter sp. F2068]MCK0103499.1 RNA pyrophosphohydrolase [Pseudohalocynthiibacter sp. F2068]
MKPDDISALPYRPCVGVMLVNSAGLIFAGQRIDSELPAWQMPQGGIDDGEDPQDAAMRELWEETGVTTDLVSVRAQTDDWLTYELPHNIIPRIWKGRFKGQKQLWFLLQFLGQDADIQIETDHPEFSEWRWIGPDEMLESIVPFKRDLYRQVIDAFRNHLNSDR